MRRMLRWALPVAVAASWLTFAAGAQAREQQVHSVVVGSRVSRSPLETRRFWTVERRAAATPLDRTRSASAAPSWAPPGITGLVGHGISTMGILYVEDQTGALYSCSATSVTSQGQNLIWTAGHCVNDQHVFMISGEFIPGANSPSDTPYGIWPLTAFYTSSTWAQYSSCTTNCPWGSDYAAAVAAPVGGQTLAGRVGSVGIAFGNTNLISAAVAAYGFPTVSPF
ncbi:MAG: hypothetical protein H0W87_06625, partial [Actinobacteria bacterium]|nr:hypothetical protein [Actinomycetota bacterium]